MWSNFEQSPLEDETISNSFSSRGIFKISSDEEVCRYPQVHASVQNKKMIIAIDKNVFLLEDEMVAKCSVLSFKTPIDVVAISHSGNLILCGLSDGEIHGIFIKGVLLFNLSIKVEDVHMDKGRTFVSVQQLNEVFYFTCANGSVYRLSEIDEAVLETTWNISINENETVAIDDGILNDISIERILHVRDLSEIVAALLISQHLHSPDGCETPLLIAATRSSLYFCSTSDDVVHLTIPQHFEGIKHIFNLENYILALTHSGHLVEVCPFTKLMLLPGGEQAAISIEELIVMECSDENIELLVLTKHSVDTERSMKIIEYPSLRCSSDLDVSDHVWLVQQPKCSINLYYMKGQQLSRTGIPASIEMVLVSETHPSERFRKLIAKGHLEEAEDFGRQFELCLQPIFEARAKRILLEMMSLGDDNPEQLEQRFLDLLEVLRKIESKEFFRTHRMFSIPSRSVLERYLNEMLQHLNDESDESHNLEIIEQLDRLKTLAIIDPYEVNVDWQKFVYHTNLVKYITTLFKTDISVACLIWKRHSGAMMPHLNENELRRVLNLIPNNTNAFNLVQWLRHFLPIVSNTHPDIMPFITDWSIQKTRALQYSEHWPEIGLEFSTKVADIFGEIQFLHSDVRRQLERCVNKLHDLVNALQDLSVLKKSYNLIVTLDNYLVDNIDETAKYILQRVHLDKLKSLVNDFIYPIYQEKGKSPVHAIRHYISLLVANRHSFSTWLDRSVACIELLHNEDDRLECALLVLQNSPVPWPDTVASLMKLRYSTHPLALKISTEYEIQMIKIMKVKYDWPADNAWGINLNLFMHRIIKKDLPDMFDDIRTLTKAAPEIASAANFNCCYRTVCRGKLQVAYEFFKTLRADKKAPYANEVLDLFADVLENSPPPLTERSVEEYRNLMEFFKLIAPRTCDATRKRLRAIERRFVLRQKYDLSINNISDLESYSDRIKLLDSGIENIIKRSQSSESICKFVTNEMRDLCAALELEKVFGVTRICRRINCLTFSCALAYIVLETVDCTTRNKQDHIDLALQILAQQILLAKGTQHSAVSAVFNENDPLAFPLAYELLVRASLYERNQLCELTELLNYVRVASGCYPLNAIESYYGSNEQKIDELVCKALCASEITVGDATLNYSTALSDISEMKSTKPEKRYSVSVFDEVDVQMQMQSQSLQTKVSRNEHTHIVKFVARALLLLITEVTPTNGLFLKLFQMLSDEAECNVDSAREDFFSSLEHLMKAKVHEVWYIMAQYLLDYQKRHDCKLINSDLVSLQMSRVLRNKMTQKEIDFLDLFVMLTADPHSKIILEKLMSDIRTDQQKVNLLTLAEMYNIHFEDTTHLEAIRAKRIKHFYYMEFCKQDASIRGKFNADIDNIEQLLREFHNKQLDVHLLERMSRDFGLDYEKLLITQIISILEAQELQYEIKTDAFGDEELVVMSAAEDMRRLCQPYIDEIKNVDLLTLRLKQFIEEIHIYFYELYICVIEMLMYFNAGPKEMQIWISILHFLKHKMTTRRRNRPGQVETDMWLQSQKELGVLPKIARYRLPFKPIVEQPLKDILDSELSVDNCESWFPLIEMHTVLKGSKEIAHNCDYFCMSAVKNSIADYKAKDDSEAWHLQPTNNAFLKSILRLIKHVHNPSKAFMILYFVSNYAPDGADQVEASFECYKYALENEDLITDQKCQEQLSKIKRKYPILKTQHLLYVYGLTDEKLMGFVENPAQLIYQLYHHEIILKAGKLDINAVVREIGELHKLDVEVIQFKLLQKWLAFTMDTSDGTVLEETFCEDQNVGGNDSEDSGNAAENVIRANYILNSWPIKDAVQFLVAHIFPPDGSANTCKQLQMYECYSKLNDGSASFKNMLSQRQYITIKCVYELKQLGYKSTVDKFANCNKIDVLKTIWQRSAQNPHTVQILATICLGFDIYISKIWNGILKRMVMFNMVRELNALVEVLSCKPQLLHTEGLALAWDCVLDYPFKNANQTRSLHQEDELHKALFRMQSCPVVHSLNLLKFAKHCIRLNREYMAAVLLAFCRNEGQLSQIKKLISERSEKMRREILDLEDAGILTFVINFTLKELEL